MVNAPVPVPQESFLVAASVEFDTAYKAETNKTMAQAGLNPTDIFTSLLAIIAQLCPKTAGELKVAATNRTTEAQLMTMSATRQVLREQHPGTFLPYIKYNGKAIVNAFLKTVASKDEPTIQAAMDCVAH